jgi:hypothetical protein
MFPVRSSYSQIQTGIVYSQRCLFQGQRKILPEIFIRRDSSEKLGITADCWGRVFSTFADAALEHGLIADKIHEARMAIRSAIAMNRPPSDLRFLFAFGVELGASFEALFNEFSNRLGKEGDVLAAIRTKIEYVLAGFAPRLDRLKENVATEEGFEYASSNLSDLSDE